MKTTDTEKPGGLLKGFKIVDLSTVYMGPFATSFLAEHDAEVIKVESPDGDISRNVGLAPQPGLTAVFQHLNRGKKSIVLDLKQNAGRATLRRLLADADAFIYNMRPSALKRLMLSYEDLRDEYPALVHVALVGYGSTGPYAGQPAYDDLIQGLSGLPDLNARATGREPTYAPMALADRLVGLYGCVGLLMALLHARCQGRGGMVEIPMFECMTHFSLVEHLYYQSFIPPTGDIGNARALSPVRKPYRSKDGYICVLPIMDKHWVKLFSLIGREELIADPRFASLQQRTVNTDVLYGILESALPERTTSEWLSLFQHADIPSSRMNGLDDLLTDPHLNAVDFFEPVASAGGQGFKHIRNPIRWEVSPEQRPAQAPALGANTVEVLRSNGFTEAEISQLVADHIAVQATATS